MAKIMIVDDNKGIVESLKTLVEQMGNDPEIAFNGEEFLKKVKKVKPDLVLLDVMMPGLQTIDILEGLKKQGLDNLKVILVTVVRLGNKEKETLFKNNNMVDYVTKPFRIMELMKVIKKHL